MTHDLHASWQGWNARYDQWKTETEVFRDTPENRRRVEAPAGKAARDAPKPKEEGRRRKKRRRKERQEGSSEDVPLRAGSPAQQNLQLIAKACALPFTLQTILADDNEMITQKVHPPPSFHDNALDREGVTMLHSLPGKMNIIEVLRKYLGAKKQEEAEEFARTRERRQEESARPPTEPTSMAVDGEADDARGLTPPACANEPASEGRAPPCPFSDTSRKAVLKQNKRRRKRFALSIIALVDVSLPLFLLYREEREQFAALIQEKTVRSAPASSDEKGGNAHGREHAVAHPRPSELYGAEHLLRFFVKLPHVLSHYEPENDAPSTPLVEEAGENAHVLASKSKSQEFAEHLRELLIFLQKNLHLFERQYFAVH